MSVRVVGFLSFLPLLFFSSPSFAGTGASSLAEPLMVRVLLAAQRETVLSSRIAGRIERMTVADGDHFRRGQTLVTMDCAIHRAKLGKVRAELEAARAALAVRERLESLRSGSAMETSLARSNLEKARAERDILRVTLDMCHIKAPYAGRVVTRKARAHQTVAQGQPLLEILDDGSLEAHLIIPSRWLNWLRPGQPFTIHLDETDRDYAARVRTIGARIDPASQSLNIIGRIDGEHAELIAGMSGSARFTEVPPAASGNGPSTVP